MPSNKLRYHNALIKYYEYKLKDFK